MKFNRNVKKKFDYIFFFYNEIDSEEATHRIMTTLIDDADLSWGEWAKIHQVGGVDDGASYEKTDDENDQEIDCPATPKATSNSTTRRQQLFVKKSKAPIAVSTTPISTPVKVAACPNAPKKAKTRAQRRAIDDDSVVQETAAFETPKKKERRTDYWVHRDTLRRNRAKAFKSVCSQLTEQTACSDEEDIILNAGDDVEEFARCGDCRMRRHVRWY